LRTPYIAPAFFVLIAALVVSLGCNKQHGDQSIGAGPWRIALKVTPDHPSMTKPITFLLHITDDRGLPVDSAQVTASLAMKSMEMEPLPMKFAAKRDGDYEASVRSPDMSGSWNLAIDATKGGTSVKANFAVKVDD
jgi:nitrogen fixation protein FixH